MHKMEYSNKLSDLIGNGGYCKKGLGPEDGKEAVKDP